MPEDTFLRAARAMREMTCLIPGCAFCTNAIKNEIDAAVAEALVEAGVTKNSVDDQ